MNEKILSTVRKLRESSKKRNFPQTFDAIITLKELDLKKPENRINEEVALPHGKGKESQVVLFSDSLKSDQAEVYNSNDLEMLSRNKRAAKKLTKTADFILAEPKLMPVVGRLLGQSLGPKGKIPKVAAGDIKTTVANLKKSVRVRLKDAPVVQCPVGSEQMTDEQVAENIESLLKHLEIKLPKGKNNIGKVELKLTMGQPEKVEM